jgi:hypothetical protein
MPPAQISHPHGQRQSQQNQNEFSRAASALFVVAVILQQVIEVGWTGSGVRIDAQTAATPGAL